MNDVFGQSYAGAYDDLYQDKDYEGECDLIERSFRGRGGPPGRSLLDFGGGTGSQHLPLARRGYDMAGVDLSSGMLDIARRKLEAALPDHRTMLATGDVRTVRLGRSFDAAIMMFAVLGYQLSNEDVIAALTSVRAHLIPGGVFVFDVWYGPAVLAERPQPRERTISSPQETIHRRSDGKLDTRHHLCDVSFQVSRIEGGREIENLTENHRMRFFFPMELELFIGIAGFKLVSLRAFPGGDREPDDSTWNVVGTAIAL
jgi:SAM-dependent methyltransferase